MNLSFSQERLWFLDQLEHGGVSYNMFIVERLTGPLDADSLERALQGVVRRHEVLRTRYPSSDGTPVQEVTDELPALERLEARDDEHAAVLVAERTNRPFDLAAGPVFRTTLIRLAPAEHVLCVVIHHIAMDGWSFGVFFDELERLYRGGTELPPLPMQYREYAEQQRERLAEVMDGQLAHWRERLADTPLLELPTDRPRPRLKTANGAAVTRMLPKELYDRLLGLARRHRCTPFMALAASYLALLARHSGQDDIVIGTPVAGRDRRELEPLIGFFLNAMVLRGDLSGDPTFSELLERVRATALDAYQNNDVPFDRLVNDLNVPRDLSRTPLFQAQLVLHNYGVGRLTLDGVTAEPFDPGRRQAKFDLSLEFGEEPEGLGMALIYNTDLFDEATIARMADHLVRLLESATADPGLRLSELDLLSPDERRQVLHGFNPDGAGPELSASTLADLMTAADPDAVALVHGADRLTYAELNARANRLARRLRTLGVGPDTRVGVCLEQSAGLAVALLAVVKSGGAYVPLDPEQPAERLAYMLEDSSAALVVTDLDLDFPVVRPDEADGEPSDDLEPLSGPDDLAYVIYTSGSTGRPKGVAVQHRQILHYLADVHDRFQVRSGASFALPQSLAYDFGITVFYLSLLTGGTLHLLESRIAGADLADYFEDHPIDYLKMTPTHLAALTADLPPERLLPRELLILGGESSSASWTASLADLGVCRVVNHYGPTETTVGVTTFEVRPGAAEGVTPIGRPLGHARIYVLDDGLKPVPIGVAGELCVGGDRLARGYLDRPDLTAERFVDSPYGRIYRTGDLARWLPDGNLEFLGRRDLQVKIRGYRVELGEVEEALRALPGVAHAVADSRDGELVGYLVGEQAPVGTLRQELASRLPDYMIPTRWMWLDELPFKSHGKVDRSALPAPSANRPSGDYEAPSGPVEELIADLWADVLKLPKVGAHDDFFDLGGHSLLATQVVARLRNGLPEGSRQVSVMDLFQHPTVRSLAVLAASTDTERGLLYRLTPSGQRSRSVVCVPYGGGSAVVYQPLADALPADTALYSVAVPGHDLGLDEDAQPLPEVAARCAEEILAGVTGPLVLYGHCGVGGAVTVEIARRLEAAGREVDAVYLGGVFPFARPSPGLNGLVARLSRLDGLRSDRAQLNWLTAMGGDMTGLDEEQLLAIARNMRHDARQAEDYFTGLLDQGVDRLQAPIVSVVGEKDPITDWYTERYREWGFLTGSTGLAVLPEGGHFFLKYRAEELAEIVTGLPPVETPAAVPVGPPPSLRRFLAIALGQLVTLTGSTLTDFAIPLWIYLQTHSLAKFASLQIVALVPGLLLAPLAGALIDRSSRRTVMLAGSAAAASVQLATGLLLWTDALETWHLYPLLACLSAALTFQRLAFTSAVPQLVPKQYLGHANGITQMSTGIAQFVAPLVAVGLMSAIGLSGILVIDLVSYVFGIGSLLLIAFPRTLPQTRREPVLTELAGGLRLTLGQPGLRSMLAFFVLLNIALSPIYLLVSPLVLSFGTLSDVGWAAVCGGAGAALGGLVMSIWGGPVKRRMTGMLYSTLGIGATCLIVGAQASLPAVAIGIFGVSFTLALVNGIYATIVQVKVPQRFHGRVFALNQMIAWSSIPLGIGVIAPLCERFLGLRTTYTLLAVAITAIALAALRTRTLARFDQDVPDATPDDLIGVQHLSGA